ncbi:hypothetical protein KUTeg_010914, partial [Tegillarca granosa]
MVFVSSNNTVIIWKFGYSCYQDCICNKTNSLSCHHQDGTCRCKDGWHEFFEMYKIQLFQSSSKRRVNKNHHVKPFYTKEVNVFLKIKEVFFKAVTIGNFTFYSDHNVIMDFTGKIVRILATCPTNFYGINCQQKCNCHNGAFCNSVTGVCVCLPGYTGDKCQDRKYKFKLGLP